MMSLYNVQKTRILKILIVKIQKFEGQRKDMCQINYSHISYQSQPGDVAPITNPIYGSQPQGADQGPAGSQMNYGNFYNPQEYKPEPQVHVH